MKMLLVKKDRPTGKVKEFVNQSGCSFNTNET